MQAPDDNGFITVTWPSKSIPHGGVFHTRVVEHSAEQQQFLKDLLQESKLNILLRKKSAYNLRQPEEKQPKRPSYQIPYVRPRTSRRRSLSTIRESGAFDKNDFRPLKFGEDREKLKEKLANTMAFGDTADPIKPPVRRGRVAAQPPKLPNEKDKWHDIVTQIRERAEWLAEMEELGEAAPHRDIIHAQIAERMRALEALGVEYASPCSSARSIKSGFSTLRSREDIHSIRSKGSTKSIETKLSPGKLSSGRNTAHRLTKKDGENVNAYNRLTSI